jgi:hypothetical protein
MHRRWKNYKAERVESVELLVYIQPAMHVKGEESHKQRKHKELVC